MMWHYKRERGKVLELVDYDTETKRAVYRYFVYDQMKNKLVPLPNLQDFNVNEEGKVLEIYEQRNKLWVSET